MAAAAAVAAGGGVRVLDRVAKHRLGAITGRDVDRGVEALVLVRIGDVDQLLGLVGRASEPLVHRDTCMGQTSAAKVVWSTFRAVRIQMRPQRADRAVASRVASPARPNSTAKTASLIKPPPPRRPSLPRWPSLTAKAAAQLFGPSCDADGCCAVGDERVHHPGVGVDHEESRTVHLRREQRRGEVRAGEGGGAPVSGGRRRCGRRRWMWRGGGEEVDVSRFIGGDREVDL